MGVSNVAGTAGMARSMIVRLLITLAVVLGGVFGLVGAPVAVAAPPDPDCPQPTFFSLPTWYKYLDVKKNPVTDRCEVTFRITTNGGVFNGDDLIRVALAIIDILTRAAALVALGFVIVGGYKYITAQGSPDGIKQALSTVLNALIGLVVAMVASAIIFFVGSNIG